METTRLFPWILILVAAAFHPCRGRSRNCADDVIQLNMMEDSAAYIYTQSEETDILAIEYLAKERQMNATLEDAWSEALSKRQTDPRLRKVPVPPGLREEHVVAIIAYTLEHPFYCQYNAVVRSFGANDAVYAENFPFKSFQYLLTVALLRLREDMGPPPQPIYRRMKVVSVGTQGERIKFGYFASSSRRKSHRDFGRKTIFTIFSEYGAQIQNYSYFPEEEEVLVPPYEAFMIKSYRSRHDGVDISLQTHGEAGIRVRVAKGSNGEFIVLRGEGSSVDSWWWDLLKAVLKYLIEYM